MSQNGLEDQYDNIWVTVGDRKMIGKQVIGSRKAEQQYPETEMAYVRVTRNFATCIEGLATGVGVGMSSGTLCAVHYAGGDDQHVTRG